MSLETDYTTAVTENLLVLKQLALDALDEGNFNRFVQIAEDIANITGASSDPGGGGGLTQNQTRDAVSEGLDQSVDIEAIKNRLPTLGPKAASGSVSVTPSSDGFGVTNTGIGLPNDSPATSNSGTFSLVALIKRFLTSISATRINARVVFASSGDNTIVAAPGAGLRIVITALRIQNNTDIATTVLIRDGATTLAGVVTTVAGTGIDDDFTYGNEIRLSANTALVMNLSAANQHSTSVRYYVETVATGLPA